MLIIDPPCLFLMSGTEYFVQRNVPFRLVSMVRSISLRAPCRIRTAAQAHVDAGVVYEDVEAAELLPALRKRRLDLTLIGDIHSDEDGIALPLRDSCGDSLALDLVHVCHYDRGALSCEMESYSFTNPGRRPRDEGYLLRDSHAEERTALIISAGARPSKQA